MVKEYSMVIIVISLRRVKNLKMTLVDRQVCRFIPFYIITEHKLQFRDFLIASYIDVFFCLMSVIFRVHNFESTLMQLWAVETWEKQYDFLQGRIQMSGLLLIVIFSSDLWGGIVLFTWPWHCYVWCYWLKWDIYIYICFIWLKAFSFDRGYTCFRILPFAKG